MQYLLRLSHVNRSAIFILFVLSCMANLSCKPKQTTTSSVFGNQSGSMAQFTPLLINLPPSASNPPHNLAMVFDSDTAVSFSIEESLQNGLAKEFMVPGSKTPNYVFLSDKDSKYVADIALTVSDSKGQTQEHTTVGCNSDTAAELVWDESQIGKGKCVCKGNSLYSTDPDGALACFAKVDCVTRSAAPSGCAPKSGTNQECESSYNVSIVTQAAHGGKACALSAGIHKTSCACPTVKYGDTVSIQNLSSREYLGWSAENFPICGEGTNKSVVLSSENLIKWIIRSASGKTGEVHYNDIVYFSSTGVANTALNNQRLAFCGVGCSDLHRARLGRSTGDDATMTWTIKDRYAHGSTSAIPYAAFVQIVSQYNSRPSWLSKCPNSIEVVGANWTDHYSSAESIANNERITWQFKP